MKRQFLLLLVAIQFLTRLPVPVARELPADALAESRVSFRSSVRSLAQAPSASISCSVHAAAGT